MILSVCHPSPETSGKESDWPAYQFLPVAGLRVNNIEKGGTPSAFHIYLQHLIHFKLSFATNSFDKAALGNTMLIVLIAK
jgi:hypothetical protein